MKNLLVLLGLATLLFGCKKLDGDNTYYLKDNCEDLKLKIEGKLIKIDKSKGVHYVNVDTINCVLQVRFDTSLDSLTWLGDTLEALGYLNVEEISDSVTIEKADSLEVKPSKEVEVIENTVEKVAIVEVAKPVKAIVVKAPKVDTSVVDTMLKVDAPKLNK